MSNETAMKVTVPDMTIYESKDKLSNRLNIPVILMDRCFYGAEVSTGGSGFLQRGIENLAVDPFLDIDDYVKVAKIVDGNVYVFGYPGSSVTFALAIDPWAIETYPVATLDGETAHIVQYE